MDGLTFQKTRTVERQKGSVFSQDYVPAVIEVLDEKWFCSVPCSLYTNRKTVTVYAGKYNVNPNRLNSRAKALRDSYKEVA